jgi:hypothetical protein
MTVRIAEGVFDTDDDELTPLFHVVAEEFRQRQRHGQKHKGGDSTGVKHSQQASHLPAGVCRVKDFRFEPEFRGSSLHPLMKRLAWTVAGEPVAPAWPEVDNPNFPVAFALA